MRIVIVGGGTAGWLAGLIISKVKPRDHTVTVIESSKINIIGAGEGSTGTLVNIIQNLSANYGCNEREFVESCDVTPKLGIDFKDWTGDGSSFISPNDGSATGKEPFDLIFAHVLANLLPEKRHLSSEYGFIIEHNKYTLDLKQGPSAYHFDAHKVGKYFKKVCGDAVKCIDAEVEHVILNDQGEIASLKLSDGRDIEGDFFIDATGLARVLMSKMGAKWNSYKDNLPVNRAMPFLLPYADDEIIRPVTTAWAQKSGWMWDIPTLHRRGCGYVYAGDFVSDDQAHAELEQTIGRKVDPLRVIKFEAGRLDKLWIKNCMAVGLCAAFAEPLEATSIHTTIVQLESLVFLYLNPSKSATCDSKAIDLYNERHIFMYDLIKDFLVAHYQGGRTDSEFWRYITAGNTITSHAKDIINVCKHRVPNMGLFPGISGASGWALWSYIMAGTNNLTPETARKELELHRIVEFAKTAYDRFTFESTIKIKDLPDNTEAIRKRQRASL
jgi:tryptophan 6-halogenase